MKTNGPESEKSSSVKSNPDQNFIQHTCFFKIFPECSNGLNLKMKMNSATRITGCPCQAQVTYLQIFMKDLSSFFSASWSETIFPTSCPPNNNPPIFFALLGNHYMVLEFKNPLLFPAPQLLRNWEDYSSPEALPWKERYSSCFQITQELKKSTSTSRITY